MVLYKNKLSKANVAKTLEGIYEIYIELGIIYDGNLLII